MNSLYFLFGVPFWLDHTLPPPLLLNTTMSRGKVFFKFRSASSGDFDHVEFTGIFIQLLDLKAAIVSKWDPGALAEGATVDYDLSIVNAQTGQEYVADDERVRKNTAVLVRRVAVPNPRRGGLLTHLRTGSSGGRGRGRGGVGSSGGHKGPQRLVAANPVPAPPSSSQPPATTTPKDEDHGLTGDIFQNEAAVARAAKEAAEAAAAADEERALAEMAKLQAQAAGSSQAFQGRNISLTNPASHGGGAGNNATEGHSSILDPMHMMGGTGTTATADMTLPSERRFTSNSGGRAFIRRGGFAGMRGTRVLVNSRARSARARAARQTSSMLKPGRNIPPRDYLCDRCGIPGHYKQDCPNRDRPEFQNFRRARKTTGIFELEIGRCGSSRYRNDPTDSGRQYRTYYDVSVNDHGGNEETKKKSGPDCRKEFNLFVSLGLVPSPLRCGGFPCLIV